MLSSVVHGFILSCIIPEILSSVDVSDTADVVFATIIFRHGDRTPVNPYPTDPYRNASYWPVGWGQLTNVGKLQHLELGQWLRDRYSHLLPLVYSENDIYVRSTDVDRTLMSAEANLAGLYPPVGNEVWDSQIRWQPIPVHTVPEKDDPVFAAKKPCPGYDSELKNLYDTPKFQRMEKELTPIYKYLTKHAGVVVDDFVVLEYIYNTLFIESNLNLTLPEWTKAVFPDKLKPWAEFSFMVDCYTTKLKRLKVGLLLNEILERIVTKSKEELVPDRRLWIYSGHDMTIGNLLMAFEAFSPPHCPPYASTILIELRKDNITLQHYVTLWYRNTTEPPLLLTLPNCTSICPLDRVISILTPILITPEEWAEECAAYHFLSNLTLIAGISCASLLLLLSGSLCIGAYFNRRRSSSYAPLPSHESWVAGD